MASLNTESAGAGCLGRSVMGVLTFGDNLTDFFHGDILVRMWPDLSPHLPREVRAAWEERLV